MFIFLLCILFSVVYSGPLMLSLPYGLQPPKACKKFKLQDEIATLKNVSELYNMLLQAKDVDAVYLKSWNGDNKGWIMTRSGRLLHYKDYKKPVYYVFCSQGGKYKDNNAKTPMKSNNLPNEIVVTFMPLHNESENNQVKKKPSKFGSMESLSDFNVYYESLE